MADPNNTGKFIFFGPDGMEVKSSGEITTVMRRIPMMPQLSEMTCWSAAAWMVLGRPPTVKWERITKKGPEAGGIKLVENWQVQEFMKLNGLVLYPMSKWSLQGIENILRTRSALFFPEGIHVLVVAGIEVNHRDSSRSRLIIYDPQPVGQGSTEMLNWGTLQDRVASIRANVSKDPSKRSTLRKRGWYGTGTYFLHR